MKFNMLRIHKLKNGQDGLVSFMVALFIMLMLTLIVLSFATVTRREQRQVLDDQLSSQAFYAAETGVNDARKVLSTTPNKSVSDCNLAAAGFNNNVLDGASGLISYTCLLINPSPSSLLYPDIPEGSSQIFPVTSASGVNVTSITLNWQNKLTNSTNYRGINCPASGNGFPTLASYASSCDMPVLRVDFVPLASVTRPNLIANTKTLFLFPQKNIGAASASFASAGTGDIVRANCVSAASPLCSVTITGLAQPSYFLRVRAIYEDASVAITASDGTNPTINLSGAQAIVDSTGKANDVLRRVQVRIPTLGISNIYPPDFAIQSNSSVCKRFFVGAGINAGTDQVDSACIPDQP